MILPRSTRRWLPVFVAAVAVGALLAPVPSVVIAAGPPTPAPSASPTPAPTPKVTPPPSTAPPPATPIAEPALIGGPQLPLSLPTLNDALYRDEGESFYMYVERNFHNEKSYPWQGGQYGFVRDPVESPLGVLFTRFHEGMDIKPLQRDARGEPLDDVMAAADGRLAHVSAQAGASNYGKYVVIEHMFGGSPYYSLYAHLSEIYLPEGGLVKRGQKFARMGHTGAGIDRTRSHLHFELNLMLNASFERWSQAVDPSDPNKHGLFNGQNLSGLDVAKLYLALKKNPALTIPEFLAGEQVYFKVLLPAGARLPDLLRLYPWMGGPAAAGGAAPSPASWEISFTRTGLPLKVLPSTQIVTGPTLTAVESSPVPYWQLTHRLLSGAGATATLSGSGLRLLNLIGHAQPPGPEDAALEGDSVPQITRPIRPAAPAARRER